MDLHEQTGNKLQIYRLLQVQITRQNNQGSFSNNLYTLPPPRNGVQKRD